MAERTTITQTTQVGVETVSGTEVDANKLFQALSITPGVKTDISQFRPKGGKYMTAAALGKEWVEAKIEGQGCYNHLVYPLSSIFNYAAPVQQGATAAYKWTFTPGQTAEDTAKTFTVEDGSALRASLFTYGIVSELGIKFDRSSVDISGTMLGQALQDGITKTAGPSAIALQPILPTTMDVYLDTTSAGLGGTKLTRVLSGEFTISDKVGPLWTLNSAVNGFAATVEIEPKASLKLMVEADSAGMALLASLRAGTKGYYRVKAVGPQISGIYYYTLWIDVCGVPTDVGEFHDEDGVYAIEWTVTPVYDATWTKTMEIQVTNVLTAL